jgi:hypothetical protein
MHEDFCRRYVTQKARIAAIHDAKSIKATYLAIHDDSLKTVICGKAAFIKRINSDPETGTIAFK